MKGENEEPSNSLPKWRRCLFLGGIVCFLASSASMAIGVFRAHQTTDYLEQARIASPFIRWGLLCSIVSLVMSGFGRGLVRWIALVCAALFVAWWLAIAESIY